MATLVAGEQYERIARQLFEIARQIGQPNGYPFDPVLLRYHLQTAIEGRFGSTPVTSTLIHVSYSVPLTVNYDLSVEEAAKLGRYDWADANITSGNFPTRRKGTARVALEFVHFNRYISTESVLRELSNRDMRSAEPHELLAFGEKYPDIQREFPIVALALGSAWRNPYGNRRVLYLDGRGSERNLRLMGTEDDWSEACRFAAVHKPVREAAA